MSRTSLLLSIGWLALLLAGLVMWMSNKGPPNVALGLLVVGTLGTLYCCAPSISEEE